MAQVEARAHVARTILAETAAVAGMAAAGLGAYLVLTGAGRWPAAAAGAAGILLTTSTVAARRRPRPLALFLDSAADRVFDGALLSAIALAARESEPVAAGAAVGALVLSFLAAYQRAKGQALGYPVEDGFASRVVRYSLVGVGLAVPSWLAESMVAVVGLTLVSSILRASQVAKKEREE